MSYRPGPDQPAVRVLQPEGDAPIPPRPSRVPLVVAAAVGAAIGFLVGGIATGVGSGQRSPTTEPASISDLAEPGEGLTPAATTTPATIAPTTTAAATDGEPSAAAFTALVPGLDGTLLLAFPEEQEWWDWSPGSARPARFQLPPATSASAWNADASAIAALAGVPGEMTLFVSDQRSFVPVFLGAVDFRWHATAPDRIAWLSPGPDGVRLHVADVTGTDVESVTSDVEALSNGARLEAWGDWGFVLTDDRREQAIPRVVTLRPSGEVAAEGAFDLLATRPDGLLLLEVEPPAGSAPGIVEHVLADPAFDVLFPIELNVTRPVVWSPSGTRRAGIVRATSGVALQVEQLEGPAFRNILGVGDAIVLTWAGEDRFVLMYSTDAGELVPGGGPAGDPIPALIVVDLIDRSTHAVPLPSRPVAAVVRP